MAAPGVGTTSMLTSLSASALSVLSWEACIMFGDEVEFIWSKSYRSPVKWLFLLTRYIGLAASFSNPFLGIGASSLSMSCKGFLILQVTASQALVTLVQTIFMIRVLALYNRNCWMAAFLLFLLVTGSIIAITGLSSTVSNTEFDRMCGVTRIHSSMTYFGFSFVATNCIVLTLTIVKCTRALVQNGGRGRQKFAPVLSLLLRDGTLGFFGTAALMIPTSLSLIIDQGALASPMTPWFIAIQSCAGCRLIINMERLSLRERHNHNHNECCGTGTPPILSTHIVIEPPNSEHEEEIS
ncbi:hypothetical protein BJ138DRAFT_1158943 [Hygrophoropsis aurantiaca]|uniref:Uncharacterized protein n=1 Tax=Hygrophoropsis aurantiaca TaxID=72124 RepID=A0ACB8A3P8_9AGAM|nr:hypothetical protein BJ138DRAFT_1158943 [Hygrophoropsis aurantiaca]